MTAPDGHSRLLGLETRSSGPSRLMVRCSSVSGGQAVFQDWPLDRLAEKTASVDLPTKLISALGGIANQAGTAREVDVYFALNVFVHLDEEVVRQAAEIVHVQINVVFKKAARG